MHEQFINTCASLSYDPLIQDNLDQPSPETLVIHICLYHPTNYSHTNTSQSLPSICYDPLHYLALILACLLIHDLLESFPGSSPLFDTFSLKNCAFLYPVFQRPSSRRVHAILICFTAPRVEVAVARNCWHFLISTYDDVNGVLQK